MSKKWYSNQEDNQNPYLVRTNVRPPPYIAKGKVGNLTEKEKVARKLTAAGIGANSMVAQHGNFYSAQLSTDFLEKPQSIRERRELYRHFYNGDELVGQAIDLHTELPLSKVRLAAPKPRTCPEGFKSPDNYGKYILSRFERMSKRLKLFQRLITIIHHYWLDGVVAVFAEDGVVEVPQHVGYDRHVTKNAVLRDDGEPVEVQEESWIERSDREQQELAYYAKNYQGWEKLIILPIDRVKITSFSFTDKVKVELIPSDKDRQLLEQAKAGDPTAVEMVQEIPQEVREHLEQGRLIPLGIDPDEGSFVFLLHGRKGADEDMGHSILDRCLSSLIYRDKLRQSQTSIASRAMTPKRIVWADKLDAQALDDLREQVDLALADPDYSIIVNYELHWEEMGARDRLLDLSVEYEQTDRRLITGLGVTESLMSGESLYSGDRLKLEVINQRYLHLREIIQEFVEEMLFKPVARRMGFVEKDEWGQEVVLYPRLSFTRLPLRDSQDTFDAMFNLYNKGSLSIDIILEALNLDPEATKAKLEQDLFTVNDSLFNEGMRSLYGELGRLIAEKTDFGEKLANYLRLKLKPAQEQGEDRYG